MCTFICNMCICFKTIYHGSSSISQGFSVVMSLRHLYIYIYMREKIEIIFQVACLLMGFSEYHQDLRSFNFPELLRGARLRFSTGQVFQYDHINLIIYSCSNIQIWRIQFGASSFQYRIIYINLKLLFEEYYLYVNRIQFLVKLYGIRFYLQFKVELEQQPIVVLQNKRKTINTIRFRLS